MKAPFFLLGLFFVSLTTSAQVGIGTISPNVKALLDLNSTSKGLLLPRMTSSQRTNMSLSSPDAGMMVYQTTTPKGIYSWNGTGWIYHAPVETGAATGHTLRWDGNKWGSVSNLFNQGSAIGIGTSAPNNLLQIHTIGFAYSAMQLTSVATGALQDDGLRIGVGNTDFPGTAHILNFENKPLWIGTNGQERMRIDSAGNVGIGTSTPGATLDVHGTLRLGENGSVLHGIMMSDIEIDPPFMNNGSEWTITLPFPDAMQGAVVYASPGVEMDGIAICYARVPSQGNVNVKIMNMGTNHDPAPVMLHIAVIQ